jgi:Protein of unknown function (DUF2934)
MARTPKREEIERKAYEIYEQRGCEDGHAEEDWFAAEHELIEQFAGGEREAPGSRIRAAVAESMQKRSVNVRGAHN